MMDTKGKFREYQLRIPPFCCVYLYVYIFLSAAAAIFVRILDFHVLKKS